MDADHVLNHERVSTMAGVDSWLSRSERDLRESKEANYEVVYGSERFRLASVTAEAK